MQPSTNLSLPLMEHFYTLQGEGRYTGHPSYFLRLAGCDVGCVWCDVKESWNATDHPKVDVRTMAGFVLESKAPIAVITGGEPLMHNLDELTSLLQDQKIRTHIETSGAHPLTGKWDWICLSPKKFKAPLDEVVEQANELKVIIYHRSDLEWAEQFAAKVSNQCLLYLQPEWSREKEITPMIIEYIQRHPKWILSLQTHKFINIP